MSAWILWAALVVFSTASTAADGGCKELVSKELGLTPLYPSLDIVKLSLSTFMWSLWIGGAESNLMRLLQRKIVKDRKVTLMA